MKYKRITERRETLLTMSIWTSDSKSLKMYNRFVVEVRKQVVKDCLQVLHNLRVGYVYDDYSWGWNEAVDAAVKQFTEKFTVRKKYKRITERRETPFVMSMWHGDSDSLKVYNRLVELENKIENGELIERTSEEYSAVRKQAVKEFAEEGKEE